jgi:cysteine desulfurase family protein
MSIYLDNAATTYPKPEEVYQSVDRALRAIGVAPGRGGHSRAMEAGRIVFQARESLAELLGIGESSRIIFTHSATEALNLAVKGLLKPGDHVVTTSMEHNALARPLHHAAEAGVDVTWVQSDTAGYVTTHQIMAALRPETKMVAMTQCSNVTGAVNPVGEIGPLLRQRGILFLVDGAQSTGSYPIDIDAMAIDLFAAPGHKGLYGPPGTGFLYIAPGIDLEPLLHGGTGSGSSELVQPPSLPERYESGTMNTPAIAGLLAGIAFVASRGVDAIHAAELALVRRLEEGLAAIPGVTVYNRGGDRPRCAVVSFTIKGMDPATIGFMLDHRHGISVRVGLHCAPLAHKSIGTFPEGTVRISPALFNTEAHIDRLLAAVRELAGTAP